MRRRKIIRITVACLITGIIMLCVSDFGHVSSDRPFGGSVLIWNRSGLDVRFDEVLVGDQTIGGGPQIIVSPKDLRQPWFEGGRDSVSFGFSSSTRQVELKLMTINELGERETVSCMLDSDLSSSSCFFQAFYSNGALLCTDCMYPR